MNYRYPEHRQNPAGDYGTLEVCESCILADAGYPPDYPDGQPGAYDVCPEWHGWGFTFTYSEDDPEEQGEPVHGFSWARCDACHSQLGGERYTVHAAHLFSVRGADADAALEALAEHRDPATYRRYLEAAWLAGWTQRDLAYAARVSQPTISRHLADIRREAGE